MARAVMVDVLDGFGNIAHDLHRNFEVAIFSVPVLFRGRE